MKSSEDYIKENQAYDAYLEKRNTTVAKGEVTIDGNGNIYIDLHSLGECPGQTPEVVQSFFQHAIEKLKSEGKL